MAEEFAADLVGPGRRKAGTSDGEVGRPSRRRRQSTAIDILQNACGVLGWAVAQVITLLAPQAVVVGGGVSQIGEALYLRPLRSAGGTLRLSAALTKLSNSARDAGRRSRCPWGPGLGGQRDVSVFFLARERAAHGVSEFERATCFERPPPKSVPKKSCGQSKRWRSQWRASETLTSCAALYALAFS